MTRRNKNRSVKTVFNKELFQDFGKKHDGVLDIEEAIQRFYQEFPEHKKDVFILDHQRFQTGADALKLIEKELDEATPSIGLVQKFSTKSMAKRCFEGKTPVSIAFNTESAKTTEFTTSEARVVVPAGVNFGAKILSRMLAGIPMDRIDNHTDIKLPKSVDNDKMWQEYVLDHELGHALTMTSTGVKEKKELFHVNYLECIADSYASMRHYQKYGEDSKLPEYISDIRIRASLTVATTHTTSNAIDEVVKLNKEGKLKNLTPQQTRDLAVKVAAKTAYTYDEQANITKEKAKYQRNIVKGKVNNLLVVENKAVAVADESTSPAFKKLMVRYLESRLNISNLPDENYKNRIKSAKDELSKSAKNMKEPQVNMFLKIIKDFGIDYQANKMPTKKPNKGFK